MVVGTGCRGGFATTLIGVLNSLFPGGLVLPGVVGRLALAFLVDFVLVEVWDLRNFFSVSNAATSTARPRRLLMELPDAHNRPGPHHGVIGIFRARMCAV